MACITINVDSSFKKRLEQFNWVNWSAVGRQEIMKRYLFEKYRKTGKLTEDENKFCEQIDWHPVDELGLRKEFIEKIKQIRKEKYTKKINSKDLEKYFDDI